MRRLLLTLFLTCLLAGLRAQTYYDLEPLLLQKCGSCHNPGDAAPFPLLKYEDFTKRLAFIKEVISSGYMPPWQADTTYAHYANERGLTPEEKKQIIAWIDNKAPKGKAAKTTATLKKTAEDPLQNRKADLVLQMDQPFLVKGDNLEKFIEYKVPFELPAGKAVEAVELVTNNKKVIHHINYGFYDVADASIDLKAGVNTIDPQEHPEQRDAFNSYKKKMVYYTGWIPGASTEYYPNAFGWTLPARGVVVFTTHYAAIAADEQSVVGVKLYFKDKPLQREVRIISLGSGGVGEREIKPALMIPPNQVSSYDLKIRTPQDQSLLYVWPHMHLLGRSFKAYAVTPLMDTIRLVNIPAWDFRWQELYRFKKPVKIPRGSMIHMTGEYDNTTNNPLNPNKPPKYVFSKGSMRSDDEMFTLLMIYAPYMEGDENIELDK